MGNVAQNKDQNRNLPVFEDNKKEYFTQVRKHIKENIKEIESTLSVKTSFNFIDEINGQHIWRTFLVNKLENYKTRMNIKTIEYVDNVIEFVEKLGDASDHYLINRLKLFLSNEIDETRSMNVITVNDGDKDIKQSPSKNEILTVCLDYIFDNLDNSDHPIKKVIQVLIFNFSRKYESELKMIENLDNESSLLEEKKSQHILDENLKNGVRKFSLNLEKMAINNKKSKNLSCDDINKFYSYLKDEILNISFILSLSIIKFYNICDDPANKIVDNIGDKVKDLLVNGDLLRFIQKLKYMAKKKILTKYKERFLEFYTIIPSDLAISPYFSLDYSLKAKFNELFCKKFNNQTKEFCQTDLFIPFSRTLIYLSEINRADSIMQKLDVLCNLRNMILEEIDSFWDEVSIKNRKKYMDPDDLLSIFIYLIIKNQQSDLIIDIEIIEDFTSQAIKLSRKGKFSLS